MGLTVVIPTVGRPSLHALLSVLPPAADIMIVDDRREPYPPLQTHRGRVVSSGGRGPAAARNAGWRAVNAEWVVFLDDDVLPDPDWPERLVHDLADLPASAGGSQGVIRVPTPARPTDWERNTAGLADARWITADMAYRRSALAAVGGFDERFPRAYREDADLAIRILAAGYGLVRGSRTVVHPVRPAGFWASVRAQAGNFDDALMRRVHGRNWRKPPGRFPVHAATVAALLLWLAPATRWAGLSAWAALTLQFALTRIRPGPRTPEEIARMLVTSALIPPAAVFWRLAGELHWRGSLEDTFDPAIAVGFMEKLRNAFKRGKGQAKETTGRVGRDRRLEGEGRGREGQGPGPAGRREGQGRGEGPQGQHLGQAEEAALTDPRP